MSGPNGDAGHGPPPGLHLYTRDGFVGGMCVVMRPSVIFEYTRVDGPHAPHRLALRDVACDDASDPAALPTTIATSRHGVVISVSGRSEPMPYAFRNAECDELHFIQEGELDYITDFGTLRACPGDFVGLGRAVTYRTVPATSSTLTVIVETPELLELSPPAPFGMVNFGRDVQRPTVDPTVEDGPIELRIKAFDGVTSYTTVHNPLACNVIVDGVAPVWKLNLASVSPLAYPNSGGPPGHFAATESTDVMVYTLSARPPAGRPPQHHNADYDELIFYFSGPGAYGAVSDPGTLVHTPKGVTHWGPEENVPDGYLAWLLETRGTVRFSDAALSSAQPMETGSFGVQRPSAASG
jgi:homogentisate 1,2-dioxygenase